ncbi:MAG: hypothetical protein K8T90_13210 [Planctomycetes bacterium]|nr:hypothetical protein [Planctomycetota bacterium]
MRNRLSLALLALLPLALSGCILLQLILLPFKLLFGAAGSVGSTVADARVEPIHGPAPTLTQMSDGRWLVEAPTEPAQFRVTLSTPAGATQSWVWPDDFRDVQPGADGIAEIPFLVAAR